MIARRPSFLNKQVIGIGIAFSVQWYEPFETHSASSLPGRCSAAAPAAPHLRARLPYASHLEA